MMPIAFAFFFTDDGFHQPSLPFGTRKLSGSSTLPGTTETSTWDLRP